MGQIGDKSLFGVYFQYRLLWMDHLLLALESTELELEIGSVIHFCLYCTQEDQIFQHGMVIKKENNEYLIQPIYINKAKFPFVKKSKALFDINLNRFSFPSAKQVVDIIMDSLRECVFIKKGLLIFTQHIMMYMSRFDSISPNNFQVVQSGIFHTIFESIKEKIAYLEGVYQSVSESKDVYESLVLSKLYHAVCSDISIPQLHAALKTDRFDEYLVVLEGFAEKLYYHYNIIAKLFYES